MLCLNGFCNEIPKVSDKVRCPHPLEEFMKEIYYESLCMNFTLYDYDIEIIMLSVKRINAIGFDKILKLTIYFA